jgi:hypothetical protein
MEKPSRRISFDAGYGIPQLITKNQMQDFGGMSIIRSNYVNSLLILF